MDRTLNSLRMTHHLSAFCLISALFIALVGCSAEDGFDSEVQPAWVYQNLLFTETTAINAAQSGSLSQPEFSWIATEKKHVVCAIFSAPISVSNNYISNQEQMVWVWHGGLGSGREGNILYSQGVKNTESNEPPEPLAPGTYYWAVWASDASGHLISSSTEYVLNVE